MPSSPAELVVLVDEDNRPTGTADKATIHHANTPLHRGFSVFLFDQSDNLLLQQRSLHKKTWPGVWSNSICGHPQPGESTIQAMQRRMREELGLNDVTVSVMLPDYRYRYEHDGVVENEFCPVAVGTIAAEVHPNPEEVADIRWIPWDAFLVEMDAPNDYSEWCVEEARLLADDEAFQTFFRQLRQG